MMEQESILSLITGEDATLLRVELLQRAASGYEQIGFWRQAAECWRDLGETSRAGVLYARGGDLGRAARIWLQAGCYREALAAYCQWEQQLLAGNTLQRLQALLGQAACHLLGTCESSPPSTPDFSEASGRQTYRRARELLAHVIEATSLVTASHWEALGDYGGWLGRYDLVQEGYERALAVLESSEERKQQIRICRAYLLQARAHADRLLCQQLEERLAAWPAEVKRPIIAPFPVKQLTLRRILPTRASEVWSIAISPDGRTLVSGGRYGDSMAKVWNLSTGRFVRSLIGHKDGVASVAISPDGRTLITGDGDGSIKVWKLSAGELVHALAGHRSTVWSVVISADGRTLISGSEDSTIKVWDLSTGELMRTLAGHKSGVASIALSPDGQTLISGSLDSTIKVWDLPTGKLVRTLTGHESYVRSVALSADGHTLVSGGYDQEIKVWELSLGQQVRILTGHTDTVRSVALSADGRTLISGSSDRTIKIWDLSTGELMRTLTDHTRVVYAVVISQDGQTLVSGSGDKTIKVWGV